MSEQSGRVAAVASAEREPTLLLVDDEENILAALRRLLRRDGYRILSATSGTEGLQLLETYPVDVIISDQRMPQMTGVEFLRKAKTSFPDTIRIVLSGYTELQSIIDAVNEGAVYKFLTKPWDDDLLRGHVQEAFRQKKLADENLILAAGLAQANEALAASYRQLEDLLAAKAKKLACDETVIEITREILESLPLGLVGLDNDNMVVFSNRSAQSIFPTGGSAIGSFAEQCFPRELQELLAGPPVEGVPWQSGATSYRVSWHRMGLASASQGKVLVLIPSEPSNQLAKEKHGSLCLD